MRLFLLSLTLVFVVLIACSEDTSHSEMITDSTDNSTMNTVNEMTSNGEEAADMLMSSTPDMMLGTDGYQLTLHTVFTPDENDELKFNTASASVIAVPADFYRGKPWVGMLFALGAEPGVDEPIHSEWGVVPDNLDFDYTPNILLPPNGYDMVMIIYAGTDLDDDIREQDILDLPFPTNQDVTSFTIDRSMIREGDPDFAPGMIRAYIDDQNVEVELANKWSTEEHSVEERTESFTNTYLLVP